MLLIRVHGTLRLMAPIETLPGLRRAKSILSYTVAHRFDQRLSCPSIPLCAPVSIRPSRPKPALCSGQRQPDRTRIAHDKALPFEPLIPNDTTIAAMREARAGGLKRFDSIEDLMKDLHAED
ncbi:DNA-damage-inducible protein J [Candidatus Burkholderia pumila]|uniref:DNA-damage-inducible protein J n=1 Tax=Candidatus Burkholderia pumila TaxID=1090375 RepID=A0ABR5HJP6_9BURK|nr:DNA-damage-inducible protein J [Candidatus Burkholderia pumila]